MVGRTFKMKKQNKPRRAYNLLKRLDWYLITVIAGVVTIEAFQELYLKYQISKSREAQKIARIYSVNNEPNIYEPNVYKPNSLENKTGGRK
jgi:hypothetical protein